MTDLDISATMKTYFACMDAADFETAKGLFAKDAQYIRSPLGGTAENPFAANGVVPIEGLPAIEEFWEKRGKKAIHHEIQNEVVVDRDWWAEGEAWATDDSDRRRFIAHATFNDEDLIQRFIAIR